MKLTTGFNEISEFRFSLTNDETRWTADVTLTGEGIRLRPPYHAEEMMLSWLDIFHALPALMGMQALREVRNLKK